MKITLEITDADLLSGLTAARERYVRENPDVPTGYSDADYVQMVVSRACESYANAYVREPTTLADARRVLSDERVMRQQASDTALSEKARREAAEAEVAAK